MTLLRVFRRVWLIVGVLVIPACASLPPERVALRTALDKAASECRVTFPFIVRYEIDPFDQLVYYYRENVGHEDREQFLDCVRDRVRDAGVRLGPAPAPTGAGTGAASPTLVYPGDLGIVSPAPSVGSERAAFSGHWVGVWNEQQSAPHALVVEQVEGTGAVVVFAGVGPSGPVWSRHRAQWVALALRLVTPDGLVVQYYARPDRTLLATMEHRNQLFTSRMTRRP